jgi:hypothetical protein
MKQNNLTRVARIERTAAEQTKRAAPMPWIRLFNDEPVPAGMGDCNVIRRTIINVDRSICPLADAGIPDFSTRNQQN